MGSRYFPIKRLSIWLNKASFGLLRSGVGPGCSLLLFCGMVKWIFPTWEKPPGFFPWMACMLRLPSDTNFLEKIIRSSTFKKQERSETCDLATLVPFSSPRSMSYNLLIVEQSCALNGGLCARSAPRWHPLVVCSVARDGGARRPSREAWQRLVGRARRP